jgi:hypothetical protein
MCLECVLPKFLEAQVRKSLHLTSKVARRKAFAEGAYEGSIGGVIWRSSGGHLNLIWRSCEGHLEVTWGKFVETSEDTDISNECSSDGK